MKPTLNRNHAGAALLPKVITAIVLRVGAIADRTAPTRLRLKAIMERFIATTQHGLPTQRLLMNTNAELPYAIDASPTTHGDARCCRTVPPIVRIVLTQAVRHRMRGAISEATFEMQVRRLTHEELESRGFELLTRHLPCGGTRFVVRAKITGTVCDTIECAPDDNGHPNVRSALCPAA